MLSTGFASGPWERQRVWRELFHGHRGLIIRDENHEYAGTRGVDAAKYCNEFRDGLGALIINSRSLADPIAVEYSQASMGTAWMLARRPEGDAWIQRLAKDRAHRRRDSWICARDWRRTNSPRRFARLRDGGPTIRSCSGATARRSIERCGGRRWIARSVISRRELGGSTCVIGCRAWRWIPCAWRWSGRVCAPPARFRSRMCGRKTESNGNRWSVFPPESPDGVIGSLFRQLSRFRMKL